MHRDKHRKPPKSDPTPPQKKESEMQKESLKIFQNGGVENDPVEDHGYRRQRMEMHPSN